MTNSTAERRVTIEKQKKFSESCLWRLQREYFDQQGIDAWVNQVPFYITSNPFIGAVYANIVIRFVRDWVAKHPDAKKHPFYIMELGTGSGRFSYYVIKALYELRQRLGMEDISIIYVMSDFTKNNIKYHETHPALLPYIEKGLIDFALYDMEAERPITLMRKNVKLDQELLVNPLTVFANYIFDTVSHDSFAVHEGKLYELLLDLSTEEQNIKDNKPVDMEKISVDYSVHEIRNSHYYSDPHLDHVLDLYKTSLKETSFLFPIGSFRAIKLLKKLSNNKLLLLSTDKGYGSLESLENLGHPSIAFHGSFSMMVNFHAIANYFKNSGGDYLLQTSRPGIRTSVFSSGFQFTDMPETTAAMYQWIEGFSPGDYFNLHRHISDSFENIGIEALAAHLNLSQWDPHIFMKICGRISSLMSEADGETVEFLAHNMPKIAANYYNMPKSECVLFEIAVFYHAIRRYKEALEYYMASIPFVGEQFGLFYNVALCLHHIGNNEESLKYFKRAQQLDPESKETEEWTAYVEKIVNEGMQTG